MEAPVTVLPIKPGLVLDILDQQSPALSATSDMPIETKPDSTPVVEKAVPSVKAEEAEQSEESATPATETPGQPAEEKTPRGVGKKIAELTKQRADAEARADAANAEKLRLLALLEQRKEVADEPVKPDRHAYDDPDSYDAAMLSYAETLATSKAKQEFEKLRAEEKETSRKAAIEEEGRKRIDSYNERVVKTREKYADFEEVAQSPDVQVSMPVVHTIMTHEQGPDIQYYLGKNPAEAARIIGYQVQTPEGPQPDVSRQLMELGLILAKINSPQPKPAVSNASPPIRPLKSGASEVVKDVNEMSMEEYAAMRTEERKAGRRH